MRRFLLAALLFAGPALADTNVKPGTIFPRAATGTLTLATGGTAQDLSTVRTAGDAISCLVKNPLTATDQGIASAERVWINFLTTATATSGAGSIPLEPGDWIIVGPQTGAVSWIAATTGHKISGVCWQ